MYPLGKYPLAPSVSLVLFVVWFVDRVDVDVAVTAPRVSTVHRPEQGRVVMASAGLVSTRKVAHQPTPTPCVVTG